MKKVKYYYSTPVHIRTIPVVTDAQGIPVYIPNAEPITVKALPRIAVAAIWDTVTNRMTFGSAVCSPKDTFIKIVGRDIAYKRALEKPEATVLITKKNRISSVSKRYAQQIIDGHLAKYVQSNI